MATALLVTSVRAALDSHGAESARGRKAPVRQSGWEPTGGAGRQAQRASPEAALPRSHGAEVIPFLGKPFGISSLLLCNLGGGFFFSSIRLFH